MSILKRVEPWHVVAAGWAFLALGFATRKKASSAAPGWPPPPGPIVLPPHRSDGSEDFSPMEPETRCDPTPKPGVVKFSQYVLSRFGGTNLGIIRECGGSMSGHTAGTAWDWGTLSGNAQVDTMMSWLFANDAEILRRAGIMYLIYDRRIWNTRSRMWQNYTGPSPHTDHVHFSFGSAGAMGRTSFYSPSIV
jgi:hypothetical protein